jgi:ATP-dependent Zn protease
MTTRFRASWLEHHRVDVRTLRRADVVGIGHVLAEVDALVARLRDPARAAALGLEPPRGILFYGPPGTGKTLVARYAAAALGAEIPFYEVSADELTPERIRGTLRYLAARHPRSVLYADEIDTVGLARDHPDHDPETRLRLTALLSALDGLLATPGPIVIASSNRDPRILDPALVRSGRLGYKVRFDTPDEDERVALFALFSRGIPGAEGIDWRHAARLTRERTPADLRQLVEDAAGLALARVGTGAGLALPPDAEPRLTDADVQAAIARSGWIEPQEDADPAFRRRLAVHEAGHTAVCVALRGPAWVYAVRLGPSEGETAYGREGIPRWQRPDGETRDGLVVAFGGIAAELALLGEGSPGGASDVAGATTAALERIGAGLTEDPAPLDLDQLGKNVAESVKASLARALVEQVRAARDRAIAIVAANVEPIRRFAAVLEAAGELTGDALQAAIAEAGFVPPEPASERSGPDTAPGAW